MNWNPSDHDRVGATNDAVARQGSASKIRIGIERDTGAQLKAHAWLMSGNHVVLGGSIDRFTHLVDHGQ